MRSESMFRASGLRHSVRSYVMLASIVGIALPGAAVAAQVAPAPWDAARLRDVSAWPHAYGEVQLAVRDDGLQVMVADSRNYAIAAASQLSLPAETARVRIDVSALSEGAKWFVRLYGELREPGNARTISVAEGESRVGELLIPLDPRWRTQVTAPVQLQLGVEGPVGALAVYRNVEFLPYVPRPNCAPRTERQPGQRDIAAVELMPNIPQPYRLIDWRAKARAYDQFVFDFTARGQYLPLIWIDDFRINIDRPTFGLQTYVGALEQGPGRRNSQEGINCLGAVLSATLVGVDKRRADHDYVAMCEAWFNTRSGLQLVLNRQEDYGGGSFWYELFPHILYYALADRYPDDGRMAEIVQITARRWQQAAQDLAGPDGIPDFHHTSYDFRTRHAVDNGKWREPDAAAAVAWLLHAAWTRSRDPALLTTAQQCLQGLERNASNPYYEILLPFGTLTAARLNAEQGHTCDVDRLLNWCFGISDCRGGWGVVTGNWGGYDCDGLLGCIDNRGGYAFMMNTCVQAGTLAPVARYQPQYARALGKWLLNVANAARLFYPGELPPGHGTSEFWTGDPERVIAYEGLRYLWQGKSPCATGDPIVLNWGPQTDLGLYGSSFAGWLAALVQLTDDPLILQIDCLATDFYHGPAYPTFLCYNPHGEQRGFALRCGPGRVDIYDAVTHRWVARDVAGQTRLSLPSDSAAVYVCVPAGVEAVAEGRTLRCQGVVVDWDTQRDASLGP